MNKLFQVINNKVSYVVKIFYYNYFNRIKFNLFF